MHNSIYVSNLHLHYILYFANFHADFRFGVPPHYKQNANFLLSQLLHLHDNWEFSISRYKLVSSRIINEFAQGCFLVINSQSSSRILCKLFANIEIQAGLDLAKATPGPKYWNCVPSPHYPFGPHAPSCLLFSTSMSKQVFRSSSI